MEGNEVILQLPISVVEEGDVYKAVCPVFKMTSRGNTMEDALNNIKKDLEKFLDDEKVQKKYHDVIKDYSIRDIEIIDVIVHMK
jgi:predicted RNase H-like HicB family nuclease